MHGMTGVKVGGRRGRAHHAVSVHVVHVVVGRHCRGWAVRILGWGWEAAHHVVGGHVGHARNPKPGRRFSSIAGRAGRDRRTADACGLGGLHNSWAAPVGIRLAGVDGRRLGRGVRGRGRSGIGPLRALVHGERRDVEARVKRRRLGSAATHDWGWGAVPAVGVGAVLSGRRHLACCGRSVSRRRNL